MSQPPNDHETLDERKRQRAILILDRVGLYEVRSVSLETLRKWREKGTWCSAYDEWEVLLSSGSDQQVIEAMTGQDEASNRLRQSPPYAAFHYLFGDD